MLKIRRSYKPSNLVTISIILIGSFISVLSMTVMTVAIPKVMDDFNILAAKAQWLNSIYVLIIGLSAPISAYLLNRYTTRQLFLSAMLSFIIGSLLGFFAPNFEILIIGRIFQAIGAGIFLPLVSAVIFAIYPKEKRGEMMGVSGLVGAVAPALGPSFSGWIIESFDWRAVFLVFLPVIIINLIVGYLVLENVTKRQSTNLDWTSVILSSIGLSAFLYGSSTIGIHKWNDWSVLGPLLGGSIIIYVFVKRQLKLAQPILDFRVFKNSVYTITSIVALVSFASMISAEVILPIYLQDILGFTSFQSAIALLPGAIILGVFSFFSGKIYDRAGAKWLAVGGMFILTLFNLLLTKLNQSNSLTYITLLQTGRMIGIAMINMPVRTAGLNHLSEKFITHGIAMGSLTRQVGAGIGTAILISSMMLFSNRHQSGGPEIEGIEATFIISSIASIIALVISLWLPRKN